MMMIDDDVSAIEATTISGRTMKRMRKRITKKRSFAVGRGRDVQEDYLYVYSSSLPCSPALTLLGGVLQLRCPHCSVGLFSTLQFNL